MPPKIANPNLKAGVARFAKQLAATAGGFYWRGRHFTKARPYSYAGIYLIRIGGLNPRYKSELVDPLFAHFSDKDGNEIFPL